MQNQETPNSNRNHHSNHQAAHSHGCCGSHGDLSSTGNNTTNEGVQDGVLDVRALIPARRHSLIFETFEGLRPSESFVLVNDHDPKPLWYQFAYEKPGAFTWNYEEQGPTVWRVRIGKTNVQDALKTPIPSAH